MDGTIYLGDRPIDGAIEAVKYLQSKYKVIYFTNNSSKNHSDYVSKLKRLGFYATESDIYTSGDAAIEFLKRERATKKVYILGTDALRQQAKNGGVNVSADSADDADIVLVGYDTTLTFAKLEKACDYIREGKEYFATHPDINCPKDGGFMPDVGAYMALIEKSTGRLPSKIFGKPEAALAKSVMSFTGLNNDQICMVGDRIITDMKFGVNADFVTFAVLSGEATYDEIIQSKLPVTEIFSGIGEIAEIMKQN